MSDKANPEFDKGIVIWLLIGCILIFVMVAIGGMTRLTNSGLSMVEWHLFMGSVPPTSESDWQILFEKYKQYPEYKHVNFNIDIAEFKQIFYWEYGHRMFGRLIGLVFILPFLWFLIKRRISKQLMPKLLIMLFLGGFQGFLGWYMVKSGLVKDPDVSHYRLAMHLITAFITFAYILWVALTLIYPSANKESLQANLKALKKPMTLLLCLVFLQIIWGAYVAGLNAGKIYNTWPLMGENMIPEAVTAMKPIWMNFIEGLAGVQFVHRYLAYIVFGLILYLFFKGKKMHLNNSQRAGLSAMLIAVSIQFVLGVFTLIYSVPIAMGLLHQLGAFVLLGTVVYSLHRFSYSQKTQAADLSTQNSQ